MKNIPSPIRYGFSVGAFLGFVASFVWLSQSNDSAHMGPTLMLYPILGPLSGILFGLFGATLGSFLVRPEDRSRRRSTLLALSTVFILSTIFLLTRAQPGLKEVVVGIILFYTAIIVAIAVTIIRNSKETI